MFRRSSSTGSTAETPAEAAERGKGRPTPSRREAEAARKARLKPTADRKALARRKRQQRLDERNKMRQALVTGEEKHLPTRDRGPVRAFCRDLVDSRFNVAEYLLPLLIVILGLSLVPSLLNLQFALWMVAIVGTTVDTIWLILRTRRELRARFASDETRGAVMYAVLRSTQLRRFRLPKARVKRGQPLPPKPAH